jgi:Apolipoprotein A1/A4/E domain
MMANQPYDPRRTERAPVTEELPVQSREPQIPLRGRPANENDPGTAMLVAKLRRPPKSTVYYGAFGVSLIWIFAWFMVNGNDLLTPEDGRLRTATEFMSALATLILPVVTFFTLAYLLWRTQQLLQVSEVLTQSAMRLIRPQEIASEGLTSVAQTIRNDVEMLVGGVEHAYKRASALEELVHKEMAAVERAFGANEDRIRSLIGGLENQRAALMQTSSIVGGEAAPLLSRLESNTQNLGQVIDHALSTFNRLEDGLKGSTQELARTIDIVSARAAEAGQEIGGHSAQFERMSSLLVGDFRGFSTQLQDYIQTLNLTAGTLGTETRKFGGEVKDMEANLLAALRDSTQQMAHNNAATAAQVQQLASSSTEQIKQVANYFGEASNHLSINVDAASTKVAERIGEAGNKLLSTLDAQGQGVAHRIEEASRVATGHLLQQSDALTGSMATQSNRFIDTVRNAIAEVLSGFNGTAANYVGTVQNTVGEALTGLDQATDRYTQAIQHNSARVNESLQGTLGEFDGSAARHVGMVQNAVGQAMAGFDQATSRYTQTIEHMSGTTINALDGNAARVNDALQNTLNGFDGTSSRHVGLIQGAVDKVMSVFDQATGRYTQTVEHFAGTTINALESNAERVNATLQNTLNGFDGTSARHVSAIENSVGQVMAGLDQATGRYTQTIEQLSANSIETLDANAYRINDTLQNTLTGALGGMENASNQIGVVASQVSSRVGDASSSVISQMQSAGASLNDLLVSTSGTIAAHLKDTTDHVTAQMHNSGIAVTNEIQTAGGFVTDRLMNVSSDFTQKLDHTRDAMLHLLENSGDTITSKLDTASAELFARLDHVSLHVTDQLESVSSRISDHILSTAGNVTDRVSTVTTQLTMQLDASSQQLSNVLNTTEVRMGGQLGQASAELTALFEANSRMLSEQLELSSNSVTATFAQTAVRAAQTLSETSTDMTSRLDQAGINMFERIDSTSRTLGQRFDVATELLEKVTSELRGRFEGSSSRFVEIMGQASHQINDDLGRVQENFAGVMGQTAMRISGRFEQDTGLLINRIDKAAQEFGSAANSSTSRLDEAHRKFAGHIETANTYFADQVLSAAHELDNRIETISMQLTGKLEMTGGRISERLDDVSNLVEKSIDKFNGEMEQMLTSRKDSLDGLTKDAARRAQEIDGVMTSYMSLIEDSLNNAELRSREISRIVNDQTQQALGGLEDELKRLEQSSSTQVAQAARVLREQHERALSSMNEMLSSTASDFQQTAQDMRITAQQVVKDIDSAREELRRAVIDLPEETRTNADAMRRVIGDQISALNALSEAVRRQSGTLDFSSPGLSQPQRSYATEPAPYTPPAANRTVTTRVIEAERAPSPVQSVTSRMADIAKAIRSTPASRAPAAASRQSQAMAEAFVDLDAAARAVVEVLDGTLPRDLERRYDNGESTVYTERLNEQRSRKMQAVLELRSQQERPLKNAVNAYIRVFERLLDELSGSGSQVDQALKSAHGLVYVLMAQAMGRMPKN